MDEEVIKSYAPQDDQIRYDPNCRPEGICTMAVDTVASMMSQLEHANDEIKRLQVVVADLNRMNAELIERVDEAEKARDEALKGLPERLRHGGVVHFR